jgi:hypothetical protein
MLIEKGPSKFFQIIPTYVVSKFYFFYFCEGGRCKEHMLKAPLLFGMDVKRRMEVSQDGARWREAV